VTLTGASTVTTGGIQVSAIVAANTSQITGGSLTTGAGVNELVAYNLATGALSIDSNVIDNGSPVAFTKLGPARCPSVATTVTAAAPL
jgi:fibronectin-binding autotransporter adhesin